MTPGIRPATPDDVPVILRFVHALATFEKAPDAVIATPELMLNALFGPHPAAECLIAELSGEPVGFALYFHNFSTWTARRGIWLDDLWVEPAARQAGVATALLKRLAQIALERGCLRFEWWVLDWNERAKSFYDRLGATPMDEWTVRRLEGEALQRLASG